MPNTPPLSRKESNKNEVPPSTEEYNAGGFFGKIKIPEDAKDIWKHEDHLHAIRADGKEWLISEDRMVSKEEEVNRLKDKFTTLNGNQQLDQVLFALSILSLIKNGNASPFIITTAATLPELLKEEEPEQENNEAPKM